MKKFIIFILSYLFFLINAYSLSIEDVSIKPLEIETICEEIDGQYPISIQAGVYFDLSGDKSHDALFGKAEHKIYQSFRLNPKETATIYYYSFSKNDNIDSIVKSMKTFIWGEKNKSELHPEEIINIENVVIVISSNYSSFFKNILTHRSDFPNIKNNEINNRIMNVKKNNSETDIQDVLELLDNYPKAILTKDALNDESILIGKYWEFNENSKLSKQGFDYIYIKKEKSKYEINYSAITPDNEEEKNKLLETIKNQENGDLFPYDKTLTDYIRENSKNKSTFLTQINNNTLAFIWRGIRIYLRKYNNNIILLTDNIKNQNNKFILTVFPTSERN